MSKVISKGGITTEMYLQSIKKENLKKEAEATIKTEASKDEKIEKKSGLQEQLDGAKYVKNFKVEKDEINICWFGGHSLHVYDDKGEQMDFFTFESEEEESTLEDVEGAVEEYMEGLME
jgi:hypothetical protein